MYVAQIMSTDLDTVTQETKLSHAAQLMREKGRRYLPVVDEEGHLQGLLGPKEIAQAEPSSITTLSVGEVNYLTSKVTAGQLMRKGVITCSPATLIEDAGRIIRENKVGCLPVIDDGCIVGVVSETDILDFFLDITGSTLHTGARIAVHLPDTTGALGTLLDHINDLGGYIATVISPISVDTMGKRIAIIRYKAEDTKSLDAQLKKLGYELITEDSLIGK